MDEIIIMKEDHGSDIHADVGDIIKIFLTENANTGYSWDLDGAIPKELDMIFNDYRITHKKTPGGSGKRAIEFVAESIGEVNLNFKYWQEWNGDDSIDDRFEITLIIEEPEE